MIRFITIALVLNSFVGYAQNKRFFRTIDSTKANFAEEWGASGAKLDVLNFDEQNYEGAILDELNAQRSLKNRSVFVQDSAYNRMCLTGLATFSKGYYTSHKNETRVHRYTEIGIRRMQGNNRLFRVIMFKIRLADIENNEFFYYDRRNFDSELQLYKGKTPTTRNPEHENYVEPVPVDELSEEDFVNNFVAKIKREISAKEFYSKHYTHISLSLRVDPSSVGRRRIPKAYVIVILGGKQTQKIKAARPIPQNNAASNNPYTILK